MAEGCRRIVLVDGTALVYRAHFAFLRNPLITSRGEPVSAIFGFANALFQLLKAEKPECVGVAFDLGAPTFRHEAFPDYKAQRPPMADDLAVQIPRVKELVRAAGMRILEEEGIEADDLIGTMTAFVRAQGVEVLIVSADKDFMQLVGPGVRMWIPPNAGGEGQWIDEAAVKEKWGVGPGQMVDLLALMGDSSDNVPGVAGIGPKTAAQLLQEHPDLDAVYEALPTLAKKSLAEKLLAGRENAFLSRELVRIRCDLPRPCTIEELRVRPLSECAELAPLLRELEFRRLLDTLGLADEETWKADYRTLDTPAALAQTLERWRASGAPLSLDTETDILDPRRSKIVGLSFAWEPGTAYYVPLGHREGANLPLEEAVPILRGVLEDPGTVLIGQNLKYDLHVLRNIGIDPAGEVRDTLLAAYLVDPDGAHDLDTLSREHLRHKTIPITDLIGKGRTQKRMDEVDVLAAATYAAEDADVALRLGRIFEERLRAVGLEALWRDLECPLLRVLLRMEDAGVKVDPAPLGALSVSMETDLRRLQAEIWRAADVEFNVASPAQLAEVLFERLRLPARKKTKTGFSTDQEVLEGLAELHPVPRLVLEHRSLSKLKGTYVDTLPQLVDPRTGRIHACFNQMVAATGRLSSSDPNLQNIPVRSPLGREIRRAFVAEPGHVLLSADYSQIELRILAHLSGDEALREAFRSGADVHAATATRIFGVAASEVDAGMRARAKVVNFGVIYGMGPFRLSRELSIPVAEARQFIEAYFAKMPGVRGYLEENLEKARREGMVTTLFGRRRVVRGLTTADPRARAQAERIVANTPIQGSAADLIKRAMLAVDSGLREHGLRARMILQVHDELVLEAPFEEADAVEALVRTSMEGAAELAVPLVVESGRGADWTEAHR